MTDTLIHEIAVAIDKASSKFGWDSHAYAKAALEVVNQREVPVIDGTQLYNLLRKQVEHQTGADETAERLREVVWPYLKRAAQPSEIPANGVEVLKNALLSINQMDSDFQTIEMAMDAAGEALKEFATTNREYGNLAPLALRRLLTLKKHKDKYGKDAFYQAEQPEAWRMAEEVINSTEGNKP